VPGDGVEVAVEVEDRRRAHGLTQGQLALRAGTTQAALSRLERDELSAERVELAMSWNRLAGEIARAGAAPRRGEA